jgi:hypothetical protein
MSLLPPAEEISDADVSFLDFLQLLILYIAMSEDMATNNVTYFTYAYFAVQAYNYTFGLWPSGL